MAMTTTPLQIPKGIDLPEATFMEPYFFRESLGIVTLLKMFEDSSNDCLFVTVRGLFWNQVK